MFPETTLVCLACEDVGDGLAVREHAQDVLASLLDALAYYLAALDVALNQIIKLYLQRTDFQRNII